MSNISDLIYEHHKREIEEKRRNMRVDKAKELYHIHDLEKSFWDKVYDVKIEYLTNGLTRYYLMDRESNVIDSFDN